MKRITYLCLLLSVILLATACTSSKKLLEKGQYDKAIQKSAKKLRKHPDDADELHVLKQAYQQANMFDKEQIDFLEKENRDANWLQIYFLYSGLEDRQDVIRSLPSSIRSQFALVDYDEQIIRAKKSAAETQYQQGLEYLNRNDRQSARKAYREFLSVQDIYPDYKDVAERLREAQYRGTNFVLLKIENNSNKVLPKDFDSELRKLSTADINSQWVQYQTYADSTMRYDYYVVINIKHIEVSPETIEKNSYTDSKKVQDGMKYVLDANGNVAKDSLGNDIKEPKMVTISADIREAIQHKNARISGSIDYIDLRTNQLVKTDNLATNAIFRHYSATFSGNKDALSKDSRKKIGGRPIPFPSDEDMLMNAAELLKDRAKKIMYQNRDLLAH